MNLLFADDDCDDFLAPLERKLERSGFNVTTALTFRDALKALEMATARNARMQSVLLDIILPFDRDGRGALRSYMGLRLAENAVRHGVRAVAFLTVVRRDEVADQFSELETTYNDVRFGYFDKTELLSRHELKNLIEFLTVTGNT